MRLKRITWLANHIRKLQHNMACLKGLLELGSPAISGIVQHHPKKGATKSATQQDNVATKTQRVAVQQLADNHELTEKQKLFCLYYIQRYNATWAYQKAYQVDKDTAHSSGGRLLSNDSVKRALSRLKQHQSEELYLTANDIMLEYIKQAFADIGDYVDFGTETEIVRDGWFKPVKDKVSGGYLRNMEVIMWRQQN